MKISLNGLRKIIRNIILENTGTEEATFDVVKNYIQTNNIKQNDIIFTDPKFQFEWEEAKRYNIFEVLGKNFYLDKAANGYTVNLSQIKDKLTNASLPSSPEDAADEFNALTSDRRGRLLKAFENKTFEKSIAIKLSNQRYDLLAGNTRLVGLAIGNIDHQIWIIDLSDIAGSCRNGKYKDLKVYKDLPENKKSDFVNACKQLIKLIKK